MTQANLAGNCSRRPSLFPAVDLADDFVNETCCPFRNAKGCIVIFKTLVLPAINIAGMCIIHSSICEVEFTDIDKKCTCQRMRVHVCVCVRAPYLYVRA